MAVVRVNKTSDFTVMSNAHFREREMSLKAKGLLSLMLSLPDEWDYSVRGLVTLSKDGIGSVMKALNELEMLGYLIRTRTHDDKGRFSGYDYDIFENPNTENPCTENPNTENPCTENPHQLNTNSLTTKEARTNELNKKKEERRKSGYDEILSTVSDASLRELYLEYIKMRKLIKAPMTDRALQMLINKVNELEPYSEDRQKQMLETAIVNNWKSVYPLKDGGRTQKPEKQSTYNSFMDELAEFVEESGKNGNSPENR